MSDELHVTTDQPSPDQIARLEQQVQEHLDGWKRAKADYLNLKKQAEKDKQDIAQFAQASAVLAFLPIYDNLKLATKHIPDDQREQEWVKGIQHILRQFEETLRTMQIEPIKSEGETFDPTLHYAVSKTKKDGAAPGTIVAEQKTGWKIGDRVLEPSQVIVAE